MRIALAQINPVVGDLLGNADRIHAALAATKVNGKIANRSFQCSFCNTHDIIMRHHTFSAIIGQCQE